MANASILGAGISGVSTSFHLGHENCVVYEAKPYCGGHIHSVTRDGFVWDDGPHVSFTKNDYIRDLLADSVEQEFEEADASISNYYKGNWIDHPAQSNLYQVPEPLRSECVESFLRSRSDNMPKPVNYEQWIHQAFGRVFAETFPAAYTRKYWTTEPTNLGVDWIGTRVFYPSVEDVTHGSRGPLGRPTNYVTKFRYPSRGGFGSYLKGLSRGANVVYKKELEAINFGKRQMRFSDGSEAKYETLVSTIPLPVLIRCSEDAPAAVREASSLLRCTSFLLVEVAVNHPAKRNDHWVYVYDEDKLSVRISFTERFSPHNAPTSCSGIAVEVYGSPYRPLPPNHDDVASKVQRELVEMDLIASLEAVRSVHVRQSPWGNVIFDHDRQPALDEITAFLQHTGVALVGRFAQWDYLMTHDCVSVSKRAAEQIKKQ